MLEWMLLPFRRYFDFEGRSRRMEYWSFHLLGLIVSVAAFALIFAGGTRNSTGDIGQAADGMYAAFGSAAFTYGPLSWAGFGILGIWALAAFIPSLALTVRRLHDRDKSGLYMLLTFIPFIGLIFSVIMLINFFMSGTPGPNRYGPDPKGIAADTSVFN
jgi:uncharacterized membrane protein YhaH (DUF805 family)